MVERGDGGERRWWREEMVKRGDGGERRWWKKRRDDVKGEIVERERAIERGGRMRGGRRKKIAL